jgi:hypothetical protein
VRQVAAGRRLALQRGAHAHGVAGHEGRVRRGTASTYGPSGGSRSRRDGSTSAPARWISEAPGSGSVPGRR